MSNYIPSVILIQIFYQLPVKSLIRFRLVSKEWKSLIDSSEFKSDYIICQLAQRKRILLRVYRGYVDDDHEREEYCWIVDDDETFPQHKISFKYPWSVNRLKNMKQDSKLVGCSHGLLCFTGEDDDCFNCYIIWNPSIKKSVTIDSPNYRWAIAVTSGFGVCPNSLDPKIVKINTFDVPYDYDYDYDNDFLCTHRAWRVEVFTLSAGVWRSPLTKLPNKWYNINLESQTPVVLNGFIYWSAYVGRMFIDCNTIISFNLESEEFTKLKLPSELARLNGDRELDLFKLRESLGVVQSEFEGSKEVHKVWLMDYNSKSFNKLFNLTLPEMWDVIGFRDNEQLIIKMIDERFKYSEKRVVSGLVAHEPNSKHFNYLGLNVGCSSFTSSYIESLLLLDQYGTMNDDG
ncbi:F-box only protein 8-like [Rutidosis leptorrhynchoides]|uniref:F-box only protein 8-like n=1 Tax=Rutidosis leptorrhynchoides TaxID=125765 RepID=UPI003A99F6BF